MAAGPNRVIASGSKYNQIFFYDSNGRLTGSTTSAPSTGATGSPAYHIKGWKTGSPTINEPDTEVITGDDTKLGEFTYDSIDARQFTVDVAIRDLTLLSRVIGVNLETLGEIRMSAMDTIDADIVNVGLIIQGPAKKYDSGSVGVAAWEGEMVPLATARFQGRVSYTEREGGVYRFSVAPQTADKKPWGISIQDSNVGTSGATYLPFSAENPIALHTFRGDNSTTAFTVQHVPISVAKTYAVTRIVGGGALEATVSTVNTSTKAVTLSAAPATNAEVHILYEFSSFVE